MARRQISEEILLDAAFAIAEREGLSKLSVRRLATECSISVGSVYSYFPAKTDLTAAVVDRFFGRAIHADFCRVEDGEGFVDYLRRLEPAMRALFSEYSASWLDELRRLPFEEREAGRAAELSRFAHMTRGLVLVLESDPAYRASGLASLVEAESLAAHVVDALLASLRGSTDFSILLVLLDKAMTSPADPALDRKDF